MHATVSGQAQTGDAAAWLGAQEGYHVAKFPRGHGLRRAKRVTKSVKEGRRPLDV